MLKDPAFALPHRYLSPFGPGLWDRLEDARNQETIRAEVLAILDTQAKAWNRGDLPTFTSVYAEDAAFLGSTGLTRGRADVLARYQKRYPDKSAMGTLSFDIVEVRPGAGSEFSSLGSDHPSRVQTVSLIARWHLTYPDGAARKTAEGLTLLVLRRSPKAWEIVSDASM